MAILLSSKNLSIVYLDTDLDVCFLFQVREEFRYYVFRYVLSPFLSLSPPLGLLECKCHYVWCCPTCVQLIQSSLTLCSLMDHSPPGSSVHGIFPARILEWVVMSSSRGSSQPRDEPASPVSPALAGGFFHLWVIGEACRSLLKCLHFFLFDFLFLFSFSDFHNSVFQLADTSSVSFNLLLIPSNFSFQLLYYLLVFVIFSLLKSPNFSFCSIHYFVLFIR